MQSNKSGSAGTVSQIMCPEKKRPISHSSARENVCMFPCIDRTPVPWQRNNICEALTQEL